MKTHFTPLAKVKLTNLIEELEFTVETIWNEVLNFGMPRWKPPLCLGDNQLKCSHN